MRLTARACLFLCCLNAGIGFTQTVPAGPKKATDSFLQRFVSDFDLPAAGEEAEARLKRAPNDGTALFVRMETAELQERPELVLDSAVRLCALPANPALQQLASSRVLQHAGNTRAFNSVLRRVKYEATLSNACTFNLRLALVAAAGDGQRKIDPDQAARSAGLVTHWRIAGPFGRFNNVDFERRWAPEMDQMSRQQYVNEAASIGTPDHAKRKIAEGPNASHPISVERFWFRDGMLSLPEYLSDPGVYYAAGDVELPKGEPIQIEALSSGSYAVSIDGEEMLLQDSRYAAGPARNSTLRRLRPGHHRIIVKFTTDAVPLSLALHPQFFHATGKPGTAKSLDRYAQGLSAYFRGDFIAMEQILDTDPAQNAPSVQYLRALLYSATEEHSPRADAAWKAVGVVQPSALLARLKSAESAVLRGQGDDTRRDVMKLLAERPQSEMALQLAFALSRNQADAPGLLDRLLELHPSCTRLAEAVKFYSSIAEQDRAREIEQQLPACAPESLQYPRMLAESGRHNAAAAYLQQLIVRNPLHRAARRLLVEQLALSSQQDAALLQARQLRDLAPNSRSSARLGQDPNTAQDSKSQRANGFTRNDEFYVPYRRDGLELVHRTAQRSFSGGSAVVLLSDKVIQVQPDGAVSVYIHRITRPLNKDGISHYGEIALPRSADLLELRTIKSSGQVIEPELAQQKATISMPALEPGDAIDEEYVTHYAELRQSMGDATAHTFGSFDTPVLYARLVLLSPPDAKLNVREQAGPPQALVGENAGTVIRIWQRDNIAQTVAESFLPSINLLPTVAIFPLETTRDRLRDQLIDTTRTGLHVNEAAMGLHLAQLSSEMEKAKRLYRFVTARVDATGPDWAGNPAEDTLQNGQGSRTSALLALARIMGLRAGLLLARKIDLSCGKERDFFCYTEPLVRFWFANGDIVDVDAESDDLPFGALPPSLETRDALFVPLLPDDDKKPEITALTGRVESEKSVAEGELSFHQGDLVATLDVRLGSARAQEIRGLLRNGGERERQAFFEQLALRIFPGATAVTGSVAHDRDAEQALQLYLHCTVPQFLNRQSGVIEIDQLVPALGLRALYAKAPARKFPLYIDSLFFESTTFHLHFSEGMQVRSVPSDFAGKSEFGEYSVRFVHSARQIDIHREFRIPVQVIAPEKYAAFSHFARQIEDAERQRISLELRKDASILHQYRVPPAIGMLR